jgi:hypothetical protein
LATTEFYIKFLTSILATHGKFIQAKKLHKKENKVLYFSESELDLMHSRATTVNDLSR